MKYVTVQMISDHSGRCRRAVINALKASSVPVETFPGTKGGRILLREANKFLARHWPDVGQITGEGQS